MKYYFRSTMFSDPKDDPKPFEAVQFVPQDGKKYFHASFSGKERIFPILEDKKRPQKGRFIRIKYKSGKGEIEADVPCGDWLCDIDGQICPQHGKFFEIMCAPQKPFVPH